MSSDEHMAANTEQRAKRLERIHSRCCVGLFKKNDVQMSNSVHNQDAHLSRAQGRASLKHFVKYIAYHTGSETIGTLRCAVRALCKVYELVR